MKKFMVYRIVQICGAAIYRKTVSFLRHTTHVDALAWNDYSEHRQEVCGLKWSPDRQLLAGGGNYNHLISLLANGGGTTDRYIRFWNTLTAQSLQCIDTGSQELDKKRQLRNERILNNTFPLFLNDTLTLPNDVPML
ncbi:unnamed protein product [Rotaria sordida]|uniref:Uncharacterized protein n=2 Tax=Rotaria sordida TaxID=392033 RepID=A0A814XPH2_9BILA|nr:unnamed protein product [Rotaria sordida]CAF1246488.1 unnamed protein product [Rotaria sordida]